MIRIKTVLPNPFIQHPQTRHRALPKPVLLALWTTSFANEPVRRDISVPLVLLVRQAQVPAETHVFCITAQIQLPGEEVELRD